MTLQGIIDASVTGSGADRVGDRIDLCKETIDLHDTLVVARGVHGMHIKGRGRATRFRWLGEYGPPVFRLTDGNGCELSDFVVELARPAKTLVHMLDSGDGPVRSSQNTLRNIYVPDARGRLEVFWRIGGEGGVDSKNDFMRGYNLDVSGCETAVVVEGRNSLNHELYGCVFKGRDAGKTAIRTINGGSVRVFGGGLIQFAESAFDVDTRNGVALLAAGVHVEKCGRLIVAPEPVTGITTHIAVLDSLRWGSRFDELAAGGEIVNYSGGTLIIRGCWFGTATEDPGTATAPWLAHHGSKFVGRACNADTAVPAADGSLIAVVERGVCTFTERGPIKRRRYVVVLIFNREGSDACNQALGHERRGDIPTIGVVPGETRLNSANGRFLGSLPQSETAELAADVCSRRSCRVRAVCPQSGLYRTRPAVLHVQGGIA